MYSSLALGINHMELETLSSWEGAEDSPTLKGCINLPTHLQVPLPVPEIPLVFRGHTQQGRKVPKTLVSNLRICYPLPGGSALVTFDDPKGELLGKPWEGGCEASQY